LKVGEDSFGFFLNLFRNPDMVVFGVDYFDGGSRVVLHFRDEEESKFDEYSRLYRVFFLR
jgi:hypothetical protein